MSCTVHFCCCQAFITECHKTPSVRYCCHYFYLFLVGPYSVSCSVELPTSGCTLHFFTTWPLFNASTFCIVTCNNISMNPYALHIGLTFCTNQQLCLCPAIVYQAQAATDHDRSSLISHKVPYLLKGCNLEQLGARPRGAKVDTMPVPCQRET